MRLRRHREFPHGVREYPGPPRVVNDSEPSDLVLVNRAVLMRRGQECTIAEHDDLFHALGRLKAENERLRHQLERPLPELIVTVPGDIDAEKIAAFVNAFLRMLGRT